MPARSGWRVIGIVSALLLAAWVPIGLVVWLIVSS